MTKNKILWSIAALLAAVLFAVSIITYAAMSGKPAIASSPSTVARWVQSDETYVTGERREEYFFTCANNGRQEGFVMGKSNGLWMAKSEHSSEQWNRVDDDFRSKEQAEQAVEKFVIKFDMCKDDK